ncbi:hypothetical protein BZA05DRAFT_173761 [Tricharina praecox]|uniref:uncharacterized protein n=1 Tax=Tricharina praecox TaxID=43433 RepID=UPI00221E3969|nr:uncharacterized protein BZA05DRAFT_173761 [Tricharina praecox]KAI5844306.1 hypothetical protein BZA05DRAFT_173761 [Tricharina praecox]
MLVGRHRRRGLAGGREVVAGAWSLGGTPMRTRWQSFFVAFSRVQCGFFPQPHFLAGAMSNGHKIRFHYYAFKTALDWLPITSPLASGGSLAPQKLRIHATPRKITAHAESADRITTATRRSGTRATREMPLRNQNPKKKNRGWQRGIELGGTSMELRIRSKLYYMWLSRVFCTRILGWSPCIKTAALPLSPHLAP